MSTRPSAVTVAAPATVVALTLALTLALDAPAVRMTAALAACLVLPGLGWARRLRLRDLGDTIALTVVLSLSTTTVVATTMAVTGTWTPPAGLAILAAVTVLGFLPVRAVVAAAGVVLLGRPGNTNHPRPPAAEEDDTADGWKDWYSDARARSDEERRQRAAEAETAEQDWRNWYTESRRSAARERSRQWKAVRERDAAAEPSDPRDPADTAATAGEGPIGAGLADTVAPDPAELVTSKSTGD